MKKIFLLLLVSLSSFAQQYQSIDHPRLLLTNQELELVKKNIAEDQYWKNIHVQLIEEADNILPLPTLERIQIGRRLLDKSRECLRRILFLGYAYRITGDSKYALRAQQELIKVSNFSDWNPSHFLDVAEMTLAVSVGYDWLFSYLSKDVKAVIKRAILEKGIEPSYDEKYNWFLNATHNWNQVCNAGMTYGALALYEEDPDYSQKVIDRAISSIHKPMEDYAPGGAYPEGVGYWIYGTSFNVLFLDAIERNFKSDFGLTASPGFLESGKYYHRAIGSSKYAHNYSDAGDKREGISPTSFWFASRTKDPSIIYGQEKYTKEIQVKDRIMPLVMIWGREISLQNPVKPTSLFWSADGKSPVTFMRSDWDSENAWFVGIKAGSPIVNHAHMDIGSYVLDVLGERWAFDLGSQNYESLESKGIKLWDKSQNGQRWEILRYNNFYHNTLNINGSLQKVDGNAEIIKRTERPEFMSSVMDLTDLYFNITSVKRGIALVNRGGVIIQDEIENGEKVAEVQSVIVTVENVEVSKNMVKLSTNGKVLYLHVEGDVDIKIADTKPVHSYDYENPGTARLLLTKTMEPKEKGSIRVYFSQSKETPDWGSIKNLSTWR